MAIYKDKKTGNWKADVWFKNRRHACRSFLKKSLAEKFERDLLAKLQEEQLTGHQAKDYTYEELFNFWYSHASLRKRETSIIKDVQMHKHYISNTLGELHVSEIKQHHFEKIVREMMIKDLSKSSINKVVQHFKAVFNHCFNAEMIARNPAKSFKQLKLEIKEMDYYSKEELDTLLSFTDAKYSAEERWKHVLYLTLFLTGARLGEVLGLEWHNVNFDRDVIIIRQNWSALEKKIIPTTKGKKDRLIPMNSLLKRELASMRNCSSGSFIFSDVEDRPIDPSNFRSRCWQADLKAAKLRAIRIHDARHTYASLFMMNGGSLYDLMAVLGHANVSTTQRYAHLSNTHLSQVRDIIMPQIKKAADVLELQKQGPEKLATLNSRSIENLNESSSISY